MTARTRQSTSRQEAEPAPARDKEPQSLIHIRSLTLRPPSGLEYQSPAESADPDELTGPAWGLVQSGFRRPPADPAGRRPPGNVSRPPAEPACD